MHYLLLLKANHSIAERACLFWIQSPPHILDASLVQIRELVVKSRIRAQALLQM